MTTMSLRDQIAQQKAEKEAQNQANLEACNDLKMKPFKMQLNLFSDLGKNTAEYLINDLGMSNENIHTWTTSYHKNQFDGLKPENINIYSAVTGATLPEYGAEYAEEDLENLVGKFIPINGEDESPKVVIYKAGLGGGTMTGATPVFVNEIHTMKTAYQKMINESGLKASQKAIMRQRDTFSLFFLTTPNRAESGADTRSKYAISALNAIKDKCAYIEVSQNDLIDRHSSNRKDLLPIIANYFTDISFAVERFYTTKSKDGINIDEMDIKTHLDVVGACAIASQEGDTAVSAFRAGIDKVAEFNSQIGFKNATNALVMIEYPFNHNPTDLDEVTKKNMLMQLNAICHSELHAKDVTLYNSDPTLENVRVTFAITGMTDYSFKIPSASISDTEKLRKMISGKASPTTKEEVKTAIDFQVMKQKEYSSLGGIKKNQGEEAYQKAKEEILSKYKNN